MDRRKKINTNREVNFMILDIIFFVLIIAMAALGFIFGFFKSLISFLGWTISLLISYLLAKAIANAFLSIGTAQWLVGDGSIFDMVYGIIPEGLKKISLDAIRQAVESGADLNGIKESIRAQSEGLLFFLTPLIQEAVCKEMYLGSALSNVGQVLALELTYQLFVIMVGVILFIVLRVIVMGLSLIFKFKLKDRSLKMWERLAGIGLGVVRGFAYACILLMVVSYIAGMSQPVKDQLDASAVGKPVTAWVSESTGKMLSGDLESNDSYKLMITALGERVQKEKTE